MFGYSQGVIAALQIQPPFIRRFFGRDVTTEQITTGDTGVDPYVQGVYALQPSLIELRGVGG